MFSRRTILRGLTVAGTLPLWRPALARPATFRMVYFGDFAPFSQLDSSGQVHGMFVDAADNLFRDKLGLGVEHQGFPWARAQAMVRNGEADGFLTVPTPERLGYVLASARPVFTFPMCVIAAPDNPRLDALRQVRRLEDLKPFRIGHYIGSGWADANLRPLGLDIQWAADLTGAMRLVANGRVDALVDNAVSMRVRLTNTEFQSRLVELPNTLTTQPYHLCIGRSSPFADMMAQIDTVLAKRPSGSGPTVAKAT
ncbi:ABC transporter substrate-binding protein [Niveispirillum sp.]|uniref:substrate-binding periplasmic protein n=1 Tax=Niveispirillum sp. TaxID=1917217 RepID=UPI001B73B312|nr:transporter substrate-binding domain-containing protein [Niveispirillum sp.]MBP7335896.1 transporter substrate-binding domain-containing protein [Niveispirillum sp.]